MGASKIIIACKIFYDELQSVLPSNVDVEVVWVEAALHVNLDRLENELKSALAAASANGAQIQLFLGIGCHPDIVRLARDYGAHTSPVKNCIEALLGPKQKELEENDTMIMTPGWIRAWPSIMAALGWDEVDVRINFGRYKRILLLEPGVNPLMDEEILSFFDLTQVPIEIEPLDLDHLKSLLTEIAG
ncbi:MAG: DUF1638 domain-containing protein [Desulfobaccales bacterium]